MELIYGLTHNSPLPKHEDARQGSFGNLEKASPRPQQKDEEFERQRDDETFTFGPALH